MVIDNVFITSFMIAFFWALVPIFYKIILQDVPAQTIFFMYYITAFTIIMIILLFQYPNVNLQLDKFTIKTFVLFVIIIFIGSLCANYLYYNILQKNQVYLVTILTAISPIFTIVVAYLFLKESINNFAWIGIILIVIGLGILAYNS